MTRRQLWGDTGGAALVEVSITIALLLALTFGAIQVGFLIWIRNALQHGVEMAARCASASDAAILAGQNLAANPTNCYNSNGNAVANATGVQQYAAQQAYGLNPAPATFTVTTLACGNEVSASYPFSYLTSYFFSTNSLTLTAQSCYPG